MDIEQALLDKMQRWMDGKNNGRLYAPMPKHPAFDDLPTRFGHARQNLIATFLPVSDNTYTALDIGAHWGSFSFFLESHNYIVTAVERDPLHASILRRLRAVFDSKVMVVESDIERVHLRDHYNVVLAMGIAHFFSRSVKDRDAFANSLPMCDVAFVQGWRHDEYSGPVTPENMLTAISLKLGLAYEYIGEADERSLYMFR